MTFYLYYVIAGLYALILSLLCSSIKPMPKDIGYKPPLHITVTIITGALTIWPVIIYWHMTDKWEDIQ